LAMCEKQDSTATGATKRNKHGRDTQHRGKDSNRKVCWGGKESLRVQSPGANLRPLGRGKKDNTAERQRHETVEGMSSKGRGKVTFEKDDFGRAQKPQKRGEKEKTKERWGGDQIKQKKKEGGGKREIQNTQFSREKKGKNV